MADLFTPGIFVPNNRSIGGIVANVTIEEVERDEVTITEHPVERGAPISDHAFKRPSVVNIRAGWSTAKTGDLSAVSGMYGLLLSWQAALNPFDLYTGKRVYHDMLISSLTVTTDETSEYSLIANITCQQVILVSVQETSVSGMSDSPGNMTNPESTGQTLDNGDTQAEQLTGTDQLNNILSNNVATSTLSTKGFENPLQTGATQGGGFP